MKSTSLLSVVCFFVLIHASISTLYEISPQAKPSDTCCIADKMELETRYVKPLSLFHHALIFSYSLENLACVYLFQDTYGKVPVDIGQSGTIKNATDGKLITFSSGYDLATAGQKVFYTTTTNTQCTAAYIPQSKSKLPSILAILGVLLLLIGGFFLYRCIRRSGASLTDPLTSKV